jgi:CMP-N-acetylneuraminic acid synthetase
MDHPNTFFSAKSSIWVIVRAMRCEIDPNQRLERANGVARTEPH